jgi:hypothetical protein
MARCRNCTFAVHPGEFEALDLVDDLLFLIHFTTSLHRLLWCPQGGDYGYVALRSVCQRKDFGGFPRECFATTSRTAYSAAKPAVQQDITCVLCPKSLPNLRRPLAYRPRVMPEFDFLQAVKPTEGYKWTHVLCATFTPDLQWSDGGHLQLTEGIMSLKPNQFGDVSLESFCSTSILYLTGVNRLQCDICGQSRAGVTIRCGDCPRRFHPACAWMSGYRFAFEMHSTVSDGKQALLRTCSLRRLSSIDRWQVSTRKGRSFDHHVQGSYRCLDAAVSVYRSLDLKGQAVL